MVNEIKWLEARWTAVRDDMRDPDFFPPLHNMEAQRWWPGGFRTAWAEAPEDDGSGEFVDEALARALTGREELLRQLLVDREHLADEIMYLRYSGLQGISSLVDLIDIPAFREDTGSLEFLARIADVTSNVYTVSSRGRSWPSGVEVEIIAVVDRSTLPIRILEYREQ